LSDLPINNSAWPFVDTFIVKALEARDARAYTSLNAALAG
jgi:hypothetical protein